MLQACYDVRNSSLMWGMMELADQFASEKVPPPEFLSTHPSNETRVRTLDALIPKVRRYVDR